MKKLVLFNNKGGVGKTTLTVNIADALGDLGLRVLLVDADPQCNLTSFFLEERQIDVLLGDSDDDESGATIWSAIKPVVRGRGTTTDVPTYRTSNPNVSIVPGDVLLADYEEELPDAWTRSFARNERGYDVLRALSDAVNSLAEIERADVVIYDVGPNVGPLNRVIILDSDFFITPVAADLFSLRALSTVGRAISKWITDYQTIRSLAAPSLASQLLSGRPQYLGYIASAFKVNVGRRASNPHEQWENKIAPRVSTRVVNCLRSIDPALVPIGGRNKVGGVKHYQSLAPSAQEHGVGIGKLKGLVNSGYNATIDEAKDSFAALAREIKSRMGV
jgi:cellulose biosynthesis protein BcsQ